MLSGNNVKQKCVKLSCCVSIHVLPQYLTNTVFWVVMPYNLIALKKEAADSSEKVVNFCQITWHHTSQSAFFIVTTKRTLNLTPLVKFKKSLYMSGQTLRVEAPTFQDNRHMKVVRLSARSTGRLYPEEIFLILISVSNPGP